jgi:RNA polymerase sigma-70 factor (ECF subfamily)
MGGSWEGIFVSDTPVQPSGSNDGATSPSLLARIVANDQDAWRRLEELYAPLISRWCRRRGLDDADADDVRQEVFIAAFRGFGSFKREENGAFRRWLKTITNSKIVDWHRRRGPGAAAGGSTAQEVLEQVESPTPPDPADDAEGKSDGLLLYRRAFDLIRLDFEETTCQAFWKVAVEGRPARDVAEELGLTRGAVDAAKYRVLKRLREEFSDLIE